MLLPAPLPPTIADAVAVVDLQCDVAQGPELRAGRRRFAAQHQVEHGALERVLLVGVIDEPKRDVVQLDQRLPGTRAGPHQARAAQSRKTILSSWDLNMA